MRLSEAGSGAEAIWMPGEEAGFFRNCLPPSAQTSGTPFPGGETDGRKIELENEV